MASALRLVPLRHVRASRAVSSIWSPLTRRRWWNHIGDDTALGGITSAMIRRQPDHLNCPSSYPFSPFSPFPFQSNPLARLRGAVPVRSTQVRPLPSLCCFGPSSPGKEDRPGKQARQASAAVVQLFIGRPTRPRQLNTQGVKEWYKGTCQEFLVRCNPPSHGRARE